MRILAITDLRGATERIPQVLELARDAEVGAVVFSGNIIGEDARAEAFRKAVATGQPHQIPRSVLDALEEEAVKAYEAFFDEMGKLDVPVFVVPGQLDAPKRLYLQAALDHEVVEPNIFMVHRSFALPLQGYNLAVAGFGGGISDNRREEQLAQVYPAWLVEFALDYVRHFKQEPMLIFHTPPKKGILDRHGDEHIGHEMIDHVIKVYHPRFAFCGAARDGQGKTHIGTTLVINPGWLKDGKYAILDTKTKHVTFGQLPEPEKAQAAAAQS